MIVLDTNVVSEAMKAQPTPAVREWLDAQVAETLYLSSITLAEMLFGIGTLPVGRRKDAMTKTLDAEAARRYAELAVAARAAGKGFSLADGYIAAIARARGFIVATRDVAPFQALGITVINPWEALS